MSPGPRFMYRRPVDLREALAELANPGHHVLGGGTDLLSCIEEELCSVEAVVDIRRIPELRRIESNADGSMSIGAAVPLAALVGSEAVRSRFALVAQAAGDVGSPAIREMGTLGGNLAQRQRCWYFRRGVKCFKRGGSYCAAVEGEHSYHTILPSGMCHAVHPSDPAVALMALGASLRLRGGSGDRIIPVSALYEGAARNAGAEVSLAPGEMIVAVELPSAAAGATSFWEKVTQRGAFDFALVSCAGARWADGTVRLALGGVSAGPWRVPPSVEEDVASGGLDEDSIDALAERALYDAAPLPGSAYKVWIAQALLRRAMRAVAKPD